MSHSKEHTKEDRKRKSHHHESSKTSDSHKTKHVKSSELKDPKYEPPIKYYNTLPSIPNGPYFIPVLNNDINNNENLNEKELKQKQQKHGPLFTSMSEFGRYHMSSLEKNYLWKPDLGFDVGIGIDLVDSDRILGIINGPIDKKWEINDIDQKYLSVILNNSTLSTLSSSNQLQSQQGFVRGKRKVNTQTKNNNPWWLRNTTYYDNNLFSQTRQRGSFDNIKKLSVENHTNDKNYDLFSIEIINKSFELINNSENKLLKHYNNKTIEWSIDILPNNNDNNESFNELSLSLLRYDEYPLNKSNNHKKHMIERTEHKENTGNVNESIDLMESSIITNIRELQTMKLTKDKAFESSLVIPSNNIIDNTNIIENNNEKYYEWIKDYVVESQVTKTTQDSYLIVLKENNELNNELTAFYNPIKTRLLMSKMSADESQPLDVILTRE